MQQTKSEHDQLVDELQKKMEAHLTEGKDQAAKLAQLEDAHSQAVKALEANSLDRETVQADLTKHRDLAVDLQQQLAQHQSRVKEHEDMLQSLKDSHATEIEQLRQPHARAVAQTEQAYESAAAVAKAELKQLRAEAAAQTDQSDQALAVAKGAEQERGKLVK